MSLSRINSYLVVWLVDKHNRMEMLVGQVVLGGGGVSAPNRIGQVGPPHISFGKLSLLALPTLKTLLKWIRLLSIKAKTDFRS